jgi:hypothetical protein
LDYVGDFKDDKFEGQGRLVLKPLGFTFEGLFVND